MSITPRRLEELYRIFDLPQDCTDEEFRQAYRREIFENHPDKNLDDVARATVCTQEINAAYDYLKRYRENPQSPLPGSGPDIVSGINFTVTISVDFGPSVDLNDIAQRKDTFKKALFDFSNNPRDTVLSLRLIHASFKAERFMEFRGLIEHPLLIDSATILLRVIGIDETQETLLRWADYLFEHSKAGQAVQILEDALSEGARDPTVLGRLRTYHYSMAQGYDSGARMKPDPPIRITHLSRIIELGFNLDYVHKLLAEAWYENGDRGKALIHLEKARAINPDFSGAIRIRRALGLMAPAEKKKQIRQKQQYPYTTHDQIPHPNQIRSWASEEKWHEILPLADMSSYSPRIIPSSRSTIRQVAASLGDCPDKRSLEFLRALTKSIYWDVRRAAESSLARWGKGNAPQTALGSEGKETSNIVDRLWDMLVFEAYHPGNDEYYLKALTKLSNRVLKSSTPDDILGALRFMTRWLELIGERKMTSWIRELIRLEAPGTWFVDPPRRDNYIKDIKMSDKLRMGLDPLFENVRRNAPGKLAQALGSQKTLGRNATFRGRKVLPGSKE